MLCTNANYAQAHSSQSPNFKCTIDSCIVRKSINATRVMRYFMRLVNSWNMYKENTKANDITAPTQAVRARPWERVI